jgi:hypothetical protein
MGKMSTHSPSHFFSSHTNHWSPLACHWLSLVVTICHWLSLVVAGCHLVVNGGDRLSVVVAGCHRLSLVVIGCHWLSLDVYCCHWLSLSLTVVYQWLSMPTYLIFLNECDEGCPLYLYRLARSK